jgi:hypothetical protein
MQMSSRHSDELDASTNDEPLLRYEIACPPKRNPEDLGLPPVSIGGSGPGCQPSWLGSRVLRFPATIREFAAAMLSFSDRLRTPTPGKQEVHPDSR